MTLFILLVMHNPPYLFLIQCTTVYLHCKTEHGLYQIQVIRQQLNGYRILLYGTETLELRYIFRDKILDHFDGLVGFRKGLSSEVMMHSLKHTQFDVATSI